MFRKQILSRRFWKRFLIYFFIYLLGFSVSTYFLRDKNETLSIAALLIKYGGFAFCMGIFSAFTNRTTIEEGVSDEKPTWQEFFGTYLLLLIIGLLLMTVLLLIGWLIFYFSSNQPVTFLPTYIKALTGVAVFCLVINGFFFIRQWLRYKKDRGSTMHGKPDP